MLIANPNEVIKTETISTYVLKGIRHVWIRITHSGWEEVKELIFPVDFYIK